MSHTIVILTAIELSFTIVICLEYRPHVPTHLKGHKNVLYSGGLSGLILTKQLARY